MSYRHSAYRKLKRGQSSDRGPTRADKNRVRAWLGMPPLPKPEGWGLPQWAWVRRHGADQRAPEL